MSEKTNQLPTEDTDRHQIRRIGDIPEIPRLKLLREDILKASYHLCTQKASLMTQYLRRNRKSGILIRALTSAHFSQFKKYLEKTRRDIPQKPWQLRLSNLLNRLYLKLDRTSESDNMIEFSKTLQYILHNMPLTVYEHELIVGNPSAFRIGAPIHPDLGGLLILPELDGLKDRADCPFLTDPEQVRELHEDIFPFWFNRSVMARMPLYSKNPELFNTILDGSFFVLSQFAGISHVTPDYQTVLKLGFKGIKRSVEKKLVQVLDNLKKNQAQNGSEDSPNDRSNNQDSLKKKIAFYKAAVIVADAAIEYGKRWKSELEKLVEETTDTARRAEIVELASLFGNIPANPPDSFHEAVQMVFITHVILHQENFQQGVSFGRMDQYLYPFYIQDINSGKITPEKAAEILGCFICKAGELLPLFFDRANEYFSGLSSASGISLGGIRPEGGSGVNDLSYLILLAYDQVRLRQPNFHIRIENDTPSEFRYLCCEVLKKGGGIPAFFSDNTIIPALEQAGISNSDARDYSVVGCVEWGIQGKSFPGAGAIFLNLAMVLQLALHDGKYNGRQFGPKTGSLETFSSIEMLLEAFRKQLINFLILTTQGNNATEITHVKHRPTPFLSIVVDGCIESGTEINAGGARYNSTGCQGVGLADVIDSVTAIDKIVYKDKKLSLSELIAAVDGNFAQHRDLRTYILNKVPKYGENKELSDHYTKIISGMYSQAVMQFKNSRGGSYFPGLWSMTTHIAFGARMPALPSGRLAGEALSNGVSPCNGRDHRGPTAALSSASHIDNRFITNGYALNQKFDMNFLKDEAGSVLLDSIILGFFKKGGMQVQFNIVDDSILKDAKAHPEKYPDLVVRVSGYSAYFNDLTEAMKDELIDRTLHCAVGGN